MRKLLIAGLLLVPSMAFANFKDVNSGSLYGDAIDSLQSQGVIGGYPDGTFRPNQSINRAELMKIIVVGALKIDPNPAIHNCFSDVTNEWFSSFVCFAHSSQWVQGYSDGTFRPNNTLTQAEALKMIVVSIIPANTYTNAGCDTSQWYGIYLCQANRLNLIQDKFIAGAPMTRGMAAEWIYNALGGVSLSSDSSSSEMSSSNISTKQCTTDDWVCSPLSTCNFKGMRDVNCVLKSGSTCLNPDKVMPPSSVSCAETIKGPELKVWIGTMMQLLTEARKPLTSKMENMSHQPNGDGCFKTLAKIDDDWVTLYNQYLGIYSRINTIPSEYQDYFNNQVTYVNQANGLLGYNWYQDINYRDTMALSIPNIVSQIRAAPTYCY
jgi:hypothetical protein